MVNLTGLIVNFTGLMVTPTIQWMDPTNMNISHTDSDFIVGPVTGSNITYSRKLMFKSLKNVTCRSVHLQCFSWCTGNYIHHR